MSDQYLAEIRMFGCNFAPLQWAMCNGQLIPISQNTALFSLLGTNYGGDGRTTFGLPNLQGKGCLDAGNGPGLSQRVVGEIGGVNTVTLSSQQMAAHNHNLIGKNASGQASPIGNVCGTAGTQLPAPNYYANAIGNAQVMNATAIMGTGGGGAHNNLIPFQVVNFCIALQGVFPQRP